MTFEVVSVDGHKSVPYQEKNILYTASDVLCTQRALSSFALYKASSFGDRQQSRKQMKFLLLITFSLAVAELRCSQQKTKLHLLQYQAGFRQQLEKCDLLNLAKICYDSLEGNFNKQKYPKISKLCNLARPKYNDRKRKRSFWQRT